MSSIDVSWRGTVQTTWNGFVRAKGWEWNLASSHVFLHLGCAAVDEELDPRDVTAVVGGEEGDGFCDLVRSPEPSHGDDIAEVGHALPANVTAAEEFLKGGGVDRSGAYNVDADTAVFRSVVQVRAKDRTAALDAE